MRKSITIQIFEKLFDKIHKYFCYHRYAFYKNDIICGRKIAVHICMFCRKKKYYGYERTKERDEIFS